MRTVQSQSAPAAVGPYSQAVEAAGLMFCSGMIPLDPGTMEVVGEDAAAQTRQVFRNLHALLGDSGRSLGDVVKSTVFLDDMGDFQAMNAVYAEEFGDHKPARSTVEVAKLPLGVKVEIECVVELA